MSNISWFSHTDNEIAVFYVKSWNICTYSVYFRLKKELDYNRFIDLNIPGANIRIYESIGFRSFSLTYNHNLSNNTQLSPSFIPIKPEFTIVIFNTSVAANCCRNSRLVINEDDLKAGDK